MVSFPCAMPLIDYSIHLLGTKLHGSEAMDVKPRGEETDISVDCTITSRPPQILIFIVSLFVGPTVRQ